MIEKLDEAIENSYKLIKEFKTTELKTKDSIS